MLRPPLRWLIYWRMGPAWGWKIDLTFFLRFKGSGLVLGIKMRLYAVQTREEMLSRHISFPWSNCEASREGRYNVADIVGIARKIRYS